MKYEEPEIKIIEIRSLNILTVSDGGTAGNGTGDLEWVKPPASF